MPEYREKNAGLDPRTSFGNGFCRKPLIGWALLCSWRPINCRGVRLKPDGTRWRREGKWRGNWRMEWVASTLTLPRNVVYPALLTLMHTPRLPAVDWTDAPADLNGLVRFDERRNLVSAHVPSPFKRTIHKFTWFKLRTLRKSWQQPDTVTCKCSFSDPAQMLHLTSDSKLVATSVGIIRKSKIFRKIWFLGLFFNCGTVQQVWTVTGGSTTVHICYGSQ